MKKILLLLIFFIFIFIILPVKADTIPFNSKSLKYYGIGVINAVNDYTVYKSPDKKSDIIREIKYNDIQNSAVIRSSETRKISYIAYVPSNNIALIPVEAISDDNWYNIYLSQETGETGWVQNENGNEFLTYKQLFYKYGKKYGVRLFSDLPQDERILYAKESKDSQVLEELKYPRFINFTIIRGNWMLVSVNDLSKQAKVGWFNWRNDDGTLNMFPNFKD